MKTVLSKQQHIQSQFAKKDPHSLPDPSLLSSTSTVGDVREYVLANRDFMNDEVQEIILALSNGDRAVNKPWSKDYELLNSAHYHTTPDVRGEAIDMLCFAMNICMACGVVPHIIEDEYDKVYKKNISRIENDY